jgi:hypothetical protein
VRRTTDFFEIAPVRSFREHESPRANSWLHRAAKAPSHPKRELRFDVANKRLFNSYGYGLRILVSFGTNGNERHDEDIGRSHESVFHGNRDA